MSDTDNMHLAVSMAQQSEEVLHVMPGSEQKQENSVNTHKCPDSDNLLGKYLIKALSWAAKI